MAQRSPRLGPVRLSLLLVLGLAAGCGQEAEAPDDAAEAAHPAEVTKVVAAPEAIAGAHVPTLDPAIMREAEIRATLGTGARCTFRYASTGQPVLAISRSPDGAPAAGIVKLNDKLIRLHPAPDEMARRTGRIALAADPIRMTVTPEGSNAGIASEVRQHVADLVFEVGKDLKVGYRGYLDCASEPTKSAAKSQGGK